ncbi:hypothetical protein R6Q57_024269 [Mikania cordata]
MASVANIIFLLILCSFSHQPYARESKFFTKIIHYLSNSPITSEPAPAPAPVLVPGFVPEMQPFLLAPTPAPAPVEEEYGYGLYGHGSSDSSLEEYHMSSVEGFKNETPEDMEDKETNGGDEFNSKKEDSFEKLLSSQSYSTNNNGYSNNVNGYSSSMNENQGYNQNGYNTNENGYNQNGYNNNEKQGYNQNGYKNEKQGYNQNGYNNEDGFNQNGYNSNENGFNQNGYNSNENGYNQNGYSNNGNGFNQNGYNNNENGFNQNGYNSNENSNNYKDNGNEYSSSMNENNGYKPDSYVELNNNDNNNYKTFTNEKSSYNNDNGYMVKQQGLSDTRFLEDGKYSYHVPNNNGNYQESSYEKEVSDNGEGYYRNFKNNDEESKYEFDTMEEYERQEGYPESTDQRGFYDRLRMRPSHRCNRIKNVKIKFVAKTKKKKETLWSQVKNLYEAAQKENPQKIGIRNENQMRGPFKRLNENAQKWVVAYREAYRQKKSGMSLKDIENDAHKIYEQESGCKFTDSIVFYEVMCKHQKWDLLDAWIFSG